MDTSLSLSNPAAVASNTAPVLPRAVTTKVQAVESTDNSATLPSNKPFVAQIVTARLSGSEFPQNPAEITPPDRTLRPYDVPMLPYDPGEATAETPGANALTSSADTIEKDT